MDLSKAHPNLLPGRTSEAKHAGPPRPGAPPALPDPSHGKSITSPARAPSQKGKSKPPQLLPLPQLCRQGLHKPGHVPAHTHSRRPWGPSMAQPQLTARRAAGGLRDPRHSSGHRGLLDGLTVRGTCIPASPGLPDSVLEPGSLLHSDHHEVRLTTPRADSHWSCQGRSHWLSQGLRSQKPGMAVEGAGTAQ